MRNGLRGLGLSFMAVVGLMAFGVAGALAQLPGESKVGEFRINGGAALLAEITGNLEGIGSLLTPGRNLAIDCAGGKVTSGKVNSATDALETLLFEGCVTWNLKLTEKLPCTVLSPGEPVGSVAAIIRTLPILHGSKNFVLIEPDTGGVFTTVELHGAECPFPLTNPVGGSISAEVTTNHAVQMLNVFSQAIQELTGDKLLLGTFPTFIDASATVELAGAHAGSTLGVL